MSEENTVGPQGPETDVEARNQKPAAAVAVKAIALDPKSQMMVAKDTSELHRQIKILMEGQAFPKTMDTPAKCIAAWNLAASFKNVAPQRAIARMMYINGTLSIWGELPKALAEGTGELEDMELFVVDKNFKIINVENKNLSADPYAAVCRMKRKGRTKNEYYFTTDEAETAGLLKKSGPWQQYAKTMLCWRAAGMAYKFEFGDALMGAEIAEYAYNQFPSERDVTTTSNNADIVNNSFGPAKAAQDATQTQ